MGAEGTGEQNEGCQGNENGTDAHPPLSGNPGEGCVEIAHETAGFLAAWQDAMPGSRGSQQARTQRDSAKRALLQTASARVNPAGRIWVLGLAQSSPLYRN